MKSDNDKIKLYIMKNGILFVIIVMIGIALYIFNRNIQEGFWNNDSREIFLQIQRTINPGIVFDTDILEKQANQIEVDYFLQHGYWPWSSEVEKLYREASSRNVYVQTNPSDSMKRAKTIYNETGILNILSQQTPEGQFLLNGVEVTDSMSGMSGEGAFGYSSGLVTNATNKNSKIIRCDGDNILIERRYLGDGIFNEHNYKTTDIDYHDLENSIPGFHFLKAPCDPCRNMVRPECPFELNLKSHVSPVWNYLWKTNT